jgi:hypothetical protein
MATDDPLDDGKTHSGALVLLGPMQPLEHPKELSGIAPVKAHAVVADKTEILAVMELAADLDPGHLLGAGIFKRVPEQVPEDLLEQ